jgi:uncharacterized membrane protein YuzA (DUF378 family)
MGLSTTRGTLILLQVFVAFTALFGAVVVVPTLPLEWLHAGPLTDYTIPAFALGICGIAAVVAVILLIVAPRLGGLASMVAGLLMIIFEVVEIAVVGLAIVEHGASNPQSWLQIVYIVIGAAGLALGYHLWRLDEEPRRMARPAH